MRYDNHQSSLVINILLSHLPITVTLLLYTFTKADTIVLHHKEKQQKIINRIKSDQEMNQIKFRN